MKSVLKNIFRNGGGRHVYLGLRVVGGDTTYEDNRLRALQHITAYRNMVKAFKTLRIPVQIIHYIEGGREELVVITRGGDKAEAEAKLNSIKNIILTAYPDYQLTRIGEAEIRAIYGWRGAKNDIEATIRFEAGVDTQLYKPRGIFKLPVQTNTNGSGIRIGRLIDTGEPYTIDVEDLRNHLSCVGSTGMGKTTTVATILNQLPRDLPYLVLDYHNEYSNLLKNVDLVIKPGYGDIGINPLAIDGSIEDNASIITDIFSEVYGFTHPQQYLFKAAVEATYTKHHLVGEAHPSLTALVRIIEEYPVKSYSEHETKAALLRRLKPLIAGQAAKVFRSEENIDIEEIMNKNVVIELGHIYEVSVRRIFGYIILKRLFNHQRETGMKNLTHLTVLEEARYLIPARRDYDPPTVAEKIVDEIRKFGESIAIVTQFPSQISKAPLKNSGLVFIHRLTGYEDILYIRNIVSLNDEQIEFVKQMGVGEALVKDNENPLPFPVKIERYV